MEQGKFAYFREPILWGIIAFLSLGLSFVAARQIIVLERLTALQAHYQRHEADLADFETRVRIVEAQHAREKKDVK